MDNCHKHPERPAEKIVNCGAYHRLCARCVSDWLDKECKCPVCGQECIELEQQNDENLAKIIAPNNLVRFLM